MKKLSIVIAFLCLTLVNRAQTFENNKEIQNLDFENIKNNMPVGWSTMGSSICKFSVDSITKVNGKYSAVIEAKSDKQVFGAWGITIPHSYEGKQITLSGYMKTENVTGSHAGLWMRLDPEAGFDNMVGQAIKGTNDWKQYTITLPLSPNKVQSIVVGGILVGTGKIWIDNLEVTIDGKKIENLNPYIKPKLAADIDNEFAKTSKLSLDVINKLTNKELTNLGLIWGYLKYYHPNIQKGMYNWDAELFRLIPKLTEIKHKERDTFLVNWIKGLGEYQPTKYEPDTANIALYPDLEWINNSNFSEELSEILLRLKDAKREDEGYYIKFTEGIGNPTFPNERELNEPYPDAGYRLLSLYRYWNIIQYFSPNRHLIGKDWKNVLSESIPYVLNANNGEEYGLAMLGVINQLNDGHADLNSTLGQLDEYYGIRLASPIISFIEENPIVTGFYNDSLQVLSPLKVGDEIISVDGKTMSQYLKERWDKTPASNTQGKYKKLADGLLRSNHRELSVTYKRNRDVLTNNILTYSPAETGNLFSFRNTLDSCFTMLTKEIAYIHIGSLKSSVLPNILDKIRGTKGLIIDFRCYPTDYNSAFILASFLSSKPVSFVKGTVGSATIPGLFVSYDGGKFGENNPNNYKGKTVVLVNEKTISAAEFATMLFQAIDNVTVIGSTTAGADGDISRIFLPGGLATNFSGVGILYPNGKETQRTGIVVDIKVEPTIKGIKEGRDEMIDKALKFLSTSKSKLYDGR